MRLRRSQTLYSSSLRVLRTAAADDTIEIRARKVSAHVVPEDQVVLEQPLARGDAGALGGYAQSADDAVVGFKLELHSIILGATRFADGAPRHSGPSYGRHVRDTL